MKRILLLLLLLGAATLAHATVTTQVYSVSFTCTGGFGPFPFTFPISESAALTVNLNGVILSPSAYTVVPVNNNFNNGGNVTLGSSTPCINGQLQILKRVTPITQTTLYYENMPTPMTMLEKSLDKLTEIDQEIWGGTTHAITIESGGVPYLLPAVGDLTLNFENCPVTGSQNDFSINCPTGGGGGGSPGGNIGQPQVNAGADVFAGSAEYLDPTQFTGSDLNAQINTAITACQAANCKIEIPSNPAGYIVVTPVVNTKDGVTIECADQGTVISWLPSAGTVFSTVGTDRTAFRNCTVDTSTAASTATCLSIGGAEYTHNSKVDNWTCGVENSTNHFAVGMHITGTDSVASGNVTVTNSYNRNFTVAGIEWDHTIDAYAVNVGNTAPAGNATHAWGTVFDTGFSGGNITNISNENSGTIIRNSMPTTGAFGKPPNFGLGIVNLVNDTCYNTSCLLLDASLSTLSGPSSSFVGYKYYFYGGSSGGSQLTNSNGGDIEGGMDVKFFGHAFRANNCHGVLLNYPNDANHGVVTFDDVTMNDNNVQNGNCDNLHVTNNTDNWHVIGGHFWGTGLGDCCSAAKFGINIVGPDNDNFTVDHVDLQHNQTSSVNDGSTGLHKVLCWSDGVSAGENCPTTTFNMARWNVDSSFFGSLEAGNPTVAFNTNTYMQYDRTGFAYDWVDASNTNMTLAQNGVLNARGGYKAGGVSTISNTGTLVGYANFGAGGDGSGTHCGLDTNPPSWGSCAGAGAGITSLAFQQSGTPVGTVTTSATLNFSTCSVSLGGSTYTIACPSVPSGTAYNYLAYQSGGGTSTMSVAPVVYAGELFGISTSGDQTANINAAATTLEGLGVPTMLKLPIGGATLVSSGVLNLKNTILLGSGTNGWNAGGLSLPTSYLNITYNSGTTPELQCLYGGWCGAQDLLIKNGANNSVMGPRYTCGVPWLVNVMWLGETAAGPKTNACDASGPCPDNDGIEFGAAGQTTTTCNSTINSPYAGYGDVNIRNLYFENMRVFATLNEQARGIHMYGMRGDFTDANPSGYAVKLGEASGSGSGLPVNANIIELSAEQAPFGSTNGGSFDHCNYGELVGLTTFATYNSVLVNNDDTGNCAHAIQVTATSSSNNDLTVQSGSVTGSVVLDAGIASDNNIIHDNVTRTLTEQTMLGANLGTTGTPTSGWNFLRVNSGGVIGFHNSGGSAYDTGMSRDAADVVDFGNGTAGNKSATLQAAVVNAGTGYQLAGAAPSGHCLVGNGTDYVDSSSCGGGGGSPGGSNTQLQYNSSGSFGGDADFTYNSGTHVHAFGSSGIIQFATSNTSVVNGCGGYSDFWIEHENQTCTNYPAASGSGTDLATAARTAIAALVNFDTLHVPCSTATFAGTLPSYPANLVGVSITTADGCPLGMVYGPSAPSFSVTNSVENSSSIVTLTATNTLKATGGDVVHLASLTTATWLNGLDVTTTSATSSNFVFLDPTSHGTSGSSAETATALLDATLGGALWTANDSGSTSPCLVDLTSSTNMAVNGLTLQDLGQSSYGCQLGATSAGGVMAFHNASVQNVTFVGSSDNIFIQGAAGDGNFYNIQTFSQWDNTKIAVTTPAFNFYNSIFYANGASNPACDFARNSNVSAQGGVGGATHGSGIVNFFESQLYTQSCSGNTHSATNIQLTGGITVNILGGLTSSTAGTQPAFMVNSATGGHAGNFHVTSNTQYDPGTLYGSANDDSSSWFLNQNPLGSALTNVAADTTGSPGATTVFRGDNSWTSNSTSVFGTSCALAGSCTPTVPLADLATQGADTVVANFTAGTAAPTAVAMPTTGTNGCAGAANALTYNTSTHALGCNSITAGGASLDSITAAGGTNSINNGNFAQTWNWLLTGSVTKGFTFTENSASTGGTALGQTLINIVTLSGSTATPLHVANTLSGSQTLPTLYITPSWNTSGSPTGFLLNATNTASGSSTLLMDLQVGASSKFNVDKSGNGNLAGGVTLGTPLTTANGGTGTGSTLTGIVRGGSPLTASELSGDCTTSGSNAVTCTKVNGGAFPTSAVVLGTNGSNQPVAATTTGSGTTVALATGPSISAPTITGHPTVEGVTSTGATGTGNFVFGTSPALTTPAIGAATGTSLYATGILDGKVTVNVVTTSACTFGTAAANCAAVNSLSGYYVNEQSTAGAAFTGTLPTAAAGLQYCVANGYNGSNPNTGALEFLTSASGQFIIFTDGTLSATGGFVSTAGAAGDAACVVGVDSTHWMLYVNRGTWTKH